MISGEQLPELHGLPAFDFPRVDRMTSELPGPGDVAWRIGAFLEWNSDADEWEGEDWEVAFARFRSAVDTTRVRALIVDRWREHWDNGPGTVISELLAARDELPELRALFIGDNYGRWLQAASELSDMTGLLTSFWHLEEFGVRGSGGLVFPVMRHERLRSLTVQSAGLDADVVRAIGASDWPALEHLDLWLGTAESGASTRMTDLAPILSGARLPRLRHLALRNSEIQDAIAAELASAPIVARLAVLDLSMGTLGDEGVTALLDGQPLIHLNRLDLWHHYISRPLQQRLRQALEPAGVTLDLDANGAWGDEDDRHIAVDNSPF